MGFSGLRSSSRSPHWKIGSRQSQAQRGWIAYSALVNAACGIADLDSVTRTALKEVFGLRNDIAHNSLDPTPNQVTEVLDLVRDTFERLGSNASDVV
jgi:hypothetical protein